MNKTSQVALAVMRGEPVFFEDRLDISIAKADRNIAMVTSDEDASIVVEAMLPHKQILRDHLGDIECTVRMGTYGH